MSAIGEEHRAAIRAWAATEWRIRRIAIFGSRAKGTHRPDSDLDIAVEIEPGEDTNSTLGQWMFESKRWKPKLEAILGTPVDLQWHDPGGFTPTIERGLSEACEVVYEKAS